MGTPAAGAPPPGEGTPTVGLEPAEPPFGPCAPEEPDCPPVVAPPLGEEAPPEDPEGNPALAPPDCPLGAPVLGAPPERPPELDDEPEGEEDAEPERPDGMLEERPDEPPEEEDEGDDGAEVGDEGEDEDEDLLAQPPISIAEALPIATICAARTAARRTRRWMFIASPIRGPGPRETLSMASAKRSWPPFDPDDRWGFNRGRRFVAASGDEGESITGSKSPRRWSHRSRRRGTP